MAERSAISQVVQLGVEVTPGTSVAASKRLQSLGFEPSPQATVSQFRPTGSKFQSLAILGQEWVEADLTGRATYDEIIYPLASVLTTPSAPTEVGGAGSAARQWVFKPANNTEDTPTTFTIEHGSAVRAAKFTYGLVNEFGMSINREAVELSGSMIGRRITDGVVLTASPTFLPLIPVTPNSFDVFVDNTDGALGTTKLGRLLSMDWNIGDRFNPVWVIDSAQNSWVAHVETEPTFGCAMVLESDSAGMAFLDYLRNNTTKFVRIKATGGGISPGTSNYSFQVDMPVKVVDTGGFDDTDGLHTINWSFVNVADSTFDAGAGGGLKVTVINTRTAL